MRGLSPVPLSPWQVGSAAKPGLLLGITNLRPEKLEAECERLLDLLPQ